MKKILLTLGLSLFIASAFATDANVKIGILDAEKILHNAPQIIAINKDLEKKFRPQHDKIMQAQQTLQSEIDRLNRENATMTEKERNNLQDQIIADKTRLRSQEENFQQNIGAAQDESMGKFMGTLKNAVSQIASKQNYDLVLLKQATAYGNEKWDITNQVLDILNKK